MMELPWPENLSDKGTDVQSPVHRTSLRGPRRARRRPDRGDRGRRPGRPAQVDGRAPARVARPRRASWSRSPGDSRYRLGPRLVTLAARIRPARSLAALARPSLEALAGSAGEAAGLSVRDGDQVHYIEQVGSPNPVSVRDWTGSRIPLHAVSSGQVLLAFSPPTFVQRYVGRPMEPFTARTLVTADALFERMRAIRRDGYTWALEEFDEGISSVAAPVADASGEVVAAVHLHGPSYRFPSAGAEAALAEEVVATAARISGSLRQAG